jgi:hypothetical protein
VAKHFLHCVAKIFTPRNYAPIVLLGFVQSNAESVKTELEVGFLFHLPYKTTDDNSASLMIATSPNVSVNTIIGLPFMKAIGMILDLVDEVVECKYLDCSPFRVEFQRTSNHVPSIIDKPPGTPAHCIASTSQWVAEIKNLERYFDAKVQGSSSTFIQNPAVHFGSRSIVRVAIRDLNDSCTAPHPANNLSNLWVPPSSIVTKDNDDYPASVLRKDGSL